MIKVIAFDLDDTLIDTSGTLIPNALSNVHLLLRNNGFPFDLEGFNLRRLNLTHDHSHKEIFEIFINELMVSDKEKSDLLEKAVSFFYEPAVMGPLPLLVGGEELLSYLQSKYPLYMVSSGRKKGQDRKIQASNVQKYFKKIYIIPSDTLSDKKAAFLDIIKSENIKPSEFLSIGNRLSNEIRFAKEVGGQTCYLEYGEHAHEQPQNDFEKPDFKIYSLKELLIKCPL